MQNYLQPEDDGLPMRASGAYVAEKLHILGNYMNIFENAMHSKLWHKRHYIDLFSGPGKCCVRTSGCVYLGSPLKALTIQNPFTNYFFVDNDPTLLEALKERCSASPLFNQVRFIRGDGNETVGGIANEIKRTDQNKPHGSWSSLNLAFLDPEGLDLRWTTVETLASVSKMDLIIHYPEMGLTRNFAQLADAADDTVIDLFFGSRKWREIFKKYRTREIPSLHRKMMDLYEEGLVDLGYEVNHAAQLHNEPLIKNRRRGKLYRLLHASKHEFGIKCWHEAIKIDVYGQRSLF